MAASLWLQALLFGLFSALSLPLGALLGIALAPVSSKVTARWMAFGSGALVFAVETWPAHIACAHPGKVWKRATQLYGESLFRLAASTYGPHPGCGPACKERCTNVVLQIICAMIGACLYLALNRWLENLGKPEQQQQQAAQCDTRSLRSLELGVGAGIETVPETSPLPPIAALSSLRRASTFHEDDTGEVTTSSGNVALSMWLGMMLDGIPEALMLGFMTNEGAVTFSFLVAIFIANFPEAFSGASLLLGQRMGVWRIMAMWLILFSLTGLLAMIGSLIMPANVERGSDLAQKRDKVTACMEGLTGGAMLAMVSTAMLPEAFKGAGDRAGLLFVLGFGLSVWITCLGYRFGSPQQMAEGAGSCAAAACPAHSSGDSVVKGCTCNDGYWGSIAAQVGKPFYSGSCTESCRLMFNAGHSHADNHCSSCNDGYTIFEPQCKVMASDQKCGGPTCAKACKGDKCGFKCAGTLAGQERKCKRCFLRVHNYLSSQEECAAQCQGEQCGFQCSGGNCASTCQGNQCAYECQSTASDVQQCGKECKGFECGYYCQGAECARSCSGDRCGAYCSGEYGQLGNCAAKCVGRQCGFECIGHQCAAECQGSRCAYRCQGDLQEIGSCGLKCQGPECAFSCQGSACAQQCTGDRCGKSCQSGTSGDQSCAKQCKGEECGALCVGATCAKSAAESWRMWRNAVPAARVWAARHRAKAASAPRGAQESDAAPAAVEPLVASPTAPRAASGAVGAGCKGEGCAMGCEGENCDQGCTGTNCGKGATPAATCKEDQSVPSGAFQMHHLDILPGQELQKNPKLCGLRATFNDEATIFFKAAAFVAFQLKRLLRTTAENG
eukprot:s3763_g2.t1